MKIKYFLVVSMISLSGISMEGAEKSIVKQKALVLDEKQQNFNEQAVKATDQLTGNMTELNSYEKELLDTMQKQMGKMQQQLDISKTHIERGQELLDQTKSSIPSSSGENVAGQMAKVEVSKKIAEMIVGLGAYQEQLANIMDQVSDVQEDIDEVQALVDTFQDNINVQLGKIDDLSKELKNL